MFMEISEYLGFITIDKDLSRYLYKKYIEHDILWSLPICWKHDSPEYWGNTLCKTKDDCDRWLEKAIAYDKEKRRRT